jgi:hypothetical protein
LALPEWKDKPFLWHLFIKTSADQYLPNCDRIFHIDSDCVFAQPCTPQDWFVGDKMLMLYTPYDAYLKRPIHEDEMLQFMGLKGSKIDYSLGQYNWRFAVEFALGHRVERECMAWHPLVFEPAIYSMTRKLLQERFPERGWDGYIRSGRNNHPQQYAEFNTMGAVAHKYFEDRYHWINIETDGYPFRGKVIPSWSHGGLDRETDYTTDMPELKGMEINTPRKLFEYLELL